MRMLYGFSITKLLKSKVKVFFYIGKGIKLYTSKALCNCNSDFIERFCGGKIMFLFFKKKVIC